ncbi:MAG: 4-hydroxy-3-methylbut-2-enyl diphosphate reductase [Bacteroidetes bacterium]|nr:4-hydroxy-3-methylbut-2-enyl diphosphate reductase [Bacteroidota bacterium]
MIVNIDKSAGFCFGVLQTIEKAENNIKNEIPKNIYVLGEIIHNPAEIKRLNKIGLKTLLINDLDSLEKENSIVIIRAHGEPPSTYNILEKLQINYVDATCPLVNQLQQKIINYYKQKYQIIIFGKSDHPEVVALRGVCNEKCFVGLNISDFSNKINFNEKSVLLTQTTMNLDKFMLLYNTLLEHFNNPELLKIENTICKFMISREAELKKFAMENDLVIFVAGRNSSNGKVLYNICKSINDKTIFIEDINELEHSMFINYNSIGITGATSTPRWYLDEVKSFLKETKNI